MSGDHDLGYKQLFAHPELVRDLLAGFTPFACFRGLAPAAFARVSASYVSDRFSERHGDMVWRVRVADHFVYVYLLLEFQSQAERWMALRMQVYVGLLYQDLVKRHELGPRLALPPVLPVVFYSGNRPWTACAELRELVAAGPSELDAFQASQRYVLIDKQSLDMDRIGQSRNLVAELFRLELSDRADNLIDALATLAAWLSGDGQAPLRRSITSWITRLLQREGHEATEEEIKSLLEGRIMGERFVRKYATWADAYKDEGRQLGLAQGREEGREEVREESLAKNRNLLKGLLAKRFGGVPAAIAERIDEAPEADIERWMYRLMDVGSMEDVIAD
ncbi:Rpn family recombination-promoting nuclease/putative transposase [Massilia horti]|uniref:Transposase (putative) YhgA-like domain-containing protein n=1 Tax=Massilia horti TaxID=2562153 RepID=A0A4Y9SRJ5_9BURK|nr:Rpn family recombination-promoting nuclease/putative transposase [Massilia horti]TFW27844.1 hypothetical protein E4O92_22665 [Massilia horti]